MTPPLSNPIGWLVTTGGVILDVQQITLHHGLVHVVATAYAPNPGELVVEAGRQPFALYGADRQPITACYTNLDTRYVATNGASLTIHLPVRFAGDAEHHFIPRQLTDQQIHYRRIPATGNGHGGQLSTEQPADD
jgi:hypothetical protein